MCCSRFLLRSQSLLIRNIKFDEVIQSIGCLFHYLTKVISLMELCQYSVWLHTQPPGIDPRQGPRIFSSSLCIQTSLEAHPATYLMGTGAPFPGGKARPRRDADHSPHLVPRSRASRWYNSSPPCRLHGGNGTFFALLFFREKIHSFHSATVVLNGVCVEQQAGLYTCWESLNILLSSLLVAQQPACFCGLWFVLQYLRLGMTQCMS